MVEIRFGLERIVYAVIAGEKKFIVVHFGGIVSEVRQACGSDKAVSHKRTGGDDSFDDATLDQIAKDQAHFADGECAGKGHDDETLFIASHRFEYICSITDLPGSIRSVAHGTHELINGAAFGKIEREDGAELVLYRVMEHTPGDCFFPLLRH